MPTAATYRYKNTQFSLSPAILQHILLKGLLTTPLLTPAITADVFGVRSRCFWREKSSLPAKTAHFSLTLIN